MDVQFLNVLDIDTWPVVAHYSMREGNLSLVGNITWMGGATTKVCIAPISVHVYVL